MSKLAMQMDEKDSVATVLNDVKIGDEVVINDKKGNKVCTLEGLEDIPFGNKIALIDMSVGDKVYKYGSIIGEVTRGIKKCELVHVHNVKSLSVDIPPAYKDEIVRQMGIVVKEER